MTVRSLRSRALAIIVLSAVLSISLFGMTQSASAHPVIVDTTPKAFQSVQAAPTEVNVFFSEGIELSYSSITVLGPDGSRVDNNDKHLVAGDTASIGVSVKPGLPEGEYTVKTKVLSAVDGHVLPDTFVFGIGTAVSPGPGGGEDILSPGYSASRFPGMVGQVMAVGAAFGALWLWKPIGRVGWLERELAGTRLAVDKSMMKIIIVGAGLVIASGIAMIVTQAISIDASVQQAIATKFGNVWITRMLQSSILMGIALAVFRRVKKTNSSPTKAELYALLIIGLAVLVTSSLIAHAAATEQILPIILDFFHDAAASIWIGGLVLLGFAVAPKILHMHDETARSTALSLLIPRFSIVVVTLLGVSVITGPLLLAALESDLSLTLASVYGQILAVKLALAGVMVVMGAYSQFVVQKKAISVMAGGKTQVAAPRLKNYDKTLKVEAGVGIALLLMVSLMANGSLPGGQFPSYQKQPGDQQAFAQSIDTSYSGTSYVPDGKIRLAISPFAVGQNGFKVAFADSTGKNVTGIEAATIKLTQVDKGIGPISVDLKKQGAGVFAADAAFSLPGRWSVQVEGVNSQGNNMLATMDLTVRPLVGNLQFKIDQYQIPGRSLPLYPVFDAQRQSIWTGDTLPGSSRLWQLSIKTGNYTAHTIPDSNLITQVILGPDETLWFIDPVTQILGHYDPGSNSTKVFKVPDDGVLSGLAMDGNGDLWIPVVQANSVVKFNPENASFTSYKIPTPGATPVGISYDDDGVIWLAEAVGKIAKIDPASGNITEIEPALQRYQLDEPTTVYPDPHSSTVYISEHGGHTVTTYNPLLGTWREYPSANEAGLPFGMVFDSYGFLWLAEHQIDRIAVIDPRTGASAEAKIPISGSFVQWLTTDDQGRIWFAAQRGGVIGSITTTAKPAAPGAPTNDTQGGSSASPVRQLGFSLSDVSGPAIVVGIAISALAYSKSATDLRSNTRSALRLGDKR